MNESYNDINFYVLQLARNIDSPTILKWVAEISRVITDMGGSSLFPARIGRSEPFLRRSGAQVIDEPMDDDMRSGATKRLATLCEEFQVQAFIAHDYDLLPVALQIKKTMHAPLIFIAQGVLQNTSFFNKRKISKQLEKVDHIICVSNYVREFYLQEFHLSEDRLSVIYEGFDLKTVNSNQVSQERTMSLAHSWGAVEDVSELVMIPGSYNDPAWCDSLVKFAMEVASEGRPNLRYIVTGDDDGSGAFARVQSSVFRIAPAQMQLVGYCADIEAAIKLTSTVLYLFSRVESQFSAALIAEALGRFVFLPKNCPASPEFIDENKTGRLLDDDPVSIREAIETFVTEEHNLRDGNFVASRSFITKYFSREEMHKKLSALFAQMGMG